MSDNENPLADVINEELGKWLEQQFSLIDNVILDRLGAVDERSKNLVWWMRYVALNNFSYTVTPNIIDRVKEIKG